MTSEHNGKVLSDFDTQKAVNMKVTQVTTVNEISTLTFWKWTLIKEKPQQFYTCGKSHMLIEISLWPL
jgi:hypothetical protein